MSKIWFDVHNTVHCEAYLHFQKTGQWPEGIEFHDIEWFGATWQVILGGQMTKSWIDHILGGNSCPVLGETEAK